MTAPVRVLINGLHAKSGGGVTYLREIMPHLVARPEIEPILLLHDSQRPLFADLDHHVPVRWVRFRSGFLRLLAWEQVRLPGLARRLKVDVTFSPANFGPLLAPRPVVLLRNTLAVGQTETRFLKRLYWWVLGIVTRASIRRAPAVLAVSRHAADILYRGVAAAHRTKLRIVPHGVSPLFRPDDAPREDFLLAVGDLYIQKNYHGLIEALARLPDGIHLRIAGRPVDADYHDRLRAQVRRTGLAARIAFLGHRTPGQLADLYRRCRLFVFPSLAETFGNPLVEAMACGAPVACAEAAAMPEIAGDAAVWFDPADPDSMARAIASMWGDDALRAQYSKRARIRAARFSWPETARLTAGALSGAAR